MVDQNTLNGTILIRRPTAVPRGGESAPAFILNRPLPGLRVGFRTDEAWRSWTFIASVWEEKLRGEGSEALSVERCAQVGKSGLETQSDIGKLAAEVDCALVGLGTCGSCTSYTIADAVAIESEGKPVVAVVTKEFEQHGHNMARFLGHADLKILVLPYPLETLPESDLRQIADDFYPTALNALGVTK